jgi:hypothetical protein
MQAIDGLNGPFENLEDPDGFSASSLEPELKHRILVPYTVHIVQGETYVVQRSKEKVTRYFQTHSRT